jgi:L-lactate permease
LASSFLASHTCSIFRVANSLARGFATIGPWFIIVAPILGWIGVALSGRNTFTNPMFGAFQASVGKLLGFPLLLLPSLNSVGAEVGKPVALHSASVGISATQFVRNEGAVIRNNRGVDVRAAHLPRRDRNSVLPVRTRGLASRLLPWWLGFVFFSRPPRPRTPILVLCR